MTLSVLCLVLLIAGVFFLSKNNEKTFTNSGYIISYKSGNTEVNNFEEGVEYKGKWYKIYKIVMRLTNDGTFEEKFNMQEHRDNRFNELQNCLL